ncbi:MAG: phytoene desaturase family protein [Desulfurivibrionaceae bacterium]
MADYSLVVIGGGLSGLAAAIRYARFDSSVLVLEKHSKPGGLNSYYRRRGYLLETGLHAMTNYSPPDARQAPLNLLLRQLKISRKKIDFHEQQGSLIRYPDKSLFFSNDPDQLLTEIAQKFPHDIDGFRSLVSEIREYPDPTADSGGLSARSYLENRLSDPLLIDMLLLPLMMYGNSAEHDLDLDLFIILFRSIFLEGLFRPAGTIKDFLDLLLEHYHYLGGAIRYQSEVREVLTSGSRVVGVRLADGEDISCDHLISTAGGPATSRLLPGALKKEITGGRMSFFESIYILPRESRHRLQVSPESRTGYYGNTNIFYNQRYDFAFQRPGQAVDPSWGVICFPGNFQDLPEPETFQIRLTHAANYEIWKGFSDGEYQEKKSLWAEKSREAVAPFLGSFYDEVVLEDSFTPLTVEKFTAKDCGAVYGSPDKIKSGKTAYDNLYLAGTDQGLLGIVGSMLSGVTMVNRHIFGQSYKM